MTQLLIKNKDLQYIEQKAVTKVYLGNINNVGLSVSPNMEDAFQHDHCQVHFSPKQFILSPSALCVVHTTISCPQTARYMD